MCIMWLELTRPATQMKSKETNRGTTVLKFSAIEKNVRFKGGHALSCNAQRLLNISLICLVLNLSGCVGAGGGGSGSLAKEGGSARVQPRALTADLNGGGGIVDNPSAPPGGRDKVTAERPASDDRASYGPIVGLQTCLFEAKQLAALPDGAYRPQVTALYHHLQVAKFYATIAGELTVGTTSLITPMYQYQIADACNGISQSLLIELKKGLIPGRGVAHK
ncbi:hypothetical protein AL485_16005 [Serratia liquefaciens]|nr:hypothetical protein AL485_16005 [Serratia liquefaciens]